jgi:hypothetical protein
MLAAAAPGRTALVGTRIVVALVGFSAIAWAVCVSSIVRLDSYVVKTAARVISGSSFGKDAWDSIELRFKDVSDQSIKPSSLKGLMIIHLRDVETRLAREPRQQVQPQLFELAGLTKDALRNTPTDGFLWLTLCWISEQVDESAEHRWRFLRSSYRMSPNEGWIGLKRNPFALGRFAVLPGDLAEDAVQELMHLVRSRLHSEVADIIAGPGSPARKQVMDRLRTLDQADRIILAGILSRKDGFEDAAKELDVEPPAPHR